MTGKSSPCVHLLQDVTPVDPHVDLRFSMSQRLAYAIVLQCTLVYSSVLYGGGNPLEPPPTTSTTSTTGATSATRDGRNKVETTTVILKTKWSHQSMSLETPA